MNRDERLTLIIPVYNREKIVVATLESVACQSRMPDEIILVDNNSTDGTKGVLESWAAEMNASGRTHVVVLEECRQGAARARQTGLDNTVTGRVTFFDSDDIMRPEYLSRIYDLFANEPEAEMAVWPLTTHYYRGGSKVRPMIRKKPMDSNQLHAMLSTPSYACATDYIRECGGWNVELHGWDDIELGHRLLLGSPRIVTSKKSMTDVYEQGEASITGVGYTHRRGEWEHVIDLMEESTLASDYPDKDHVMRLLAYRRAILGALYRREGNMEAARENLDRAVGSACLSDLQRAYLRLAYALTSRGVPGMARLVPYIF